MTTIQDIDFSVDLMRSILWQYDEKPKIIELVELKDDWYKKNNEDFWNDWFRDVFDIRTCNQFGMAVWSIILNVPLHVPVPPTATKPTFGFGSYNQNFYGGNFARLEKTTVGLSVEAQRKLLLLRYNQLVGSVSVIGINESLKRILSDLGLIYVVDHQDMTMTYVFTFIPDSEFWFIATNADVFPRPTGVRINYMIITGPMQNFGFGVNNKNFDNGNFIKPYMEG